MWGLAPHGVISTDEVTSTRDGVEGKRASAVAQGSIPTVVSSRKPMVYTLSPT